MLRSLLDLYSLVLLASVVLSWVDLPPDNPFVRVVRQLTEPVLAQVRRVLPSAGGFDFSALVVMFGIQFLKRLL